MFHSKNDRLFFRLFLLMSFVLPCFLVQGFVKFPSQETTKTGKPSNIDVQFVEVQPGIRLKIKFETIIGISFQNGIRGKGKWRNLVGSKYVIGNLHSTDVTPLLWRKIELRLKKADGSIAEVTLLRPLWWLKANHAKIDKDIRINFSEARLRGVARIIKISKCNSDSRKVKGGYQLVIGKIKHHNANIINIFLGDDESRLGVTPNHLIFSLDRDNWIRAGSLKIGEELKTATGSPVLVRRITKGKKQTVYNLEIHRKHTYFVSKYKVLVHNACDDIALGLDPYYKNLANSTGSADWRAWQSKGIIHQPVSPRFGRQLTQALSRAKTIHFDVAGIDNLAEAFKSGTKGIVYKPDGMKNVTNYELFRVVSNSNFLAKTKWYRNGAPIPAPFTKVLSHKNAIR